MISFKLNALLTGPVRPLGPQGVPSGIAKSQVSAPLLLTRSGLDGDRQGDMIRHGGPEKAVHHYPFEHYPAWKEAIGSSSILGRPGAFGENLSTIGLTESNVSIGDVFELGSAVVEVSQGRQPCWKLNERFDRSAMAKLVQGSGRTGWYYRVLQPGLVSPDDRLTRIDRLSPEWTLARVWRVFYVDTLNRPELERLAELPRLAESWRNHAIRRLQSNKVENWTARLNGDEGSN